MTSFKLPLMVVGASLFLFASPAYSGNAYVSAGKLSVQPDTSGASNLTLSVSGPDGFSAQQAYSYGAPSVDISGSTGLVDGEYTWELTGSTSERVRNPNAGLDNGRDAPSPDFVNKPFTEAGAFRVIGGVVQMPDGALESESERGAN